MTFHNCYSKKGWAPLCSACLYLSWVFARKYRSGAIAVPLFLWRPQGGWTVDARGSPVVSFCPSTHGEQGRACTQSSATNMYTRSNNNYDFAAPLKNDNHIPRANLLFKFQNFYYPCSILTIKLAKSESMFCLMIFELFDRQRPNVSTTPLWQWGFRQCLYFSWTTCKDVIIAGTPLPQREL